MNGKILKLLLFISIIFFVLGTGYASESDEHKDNFNNFNTSQWNIISGIWETVNGKITSTGGVVSIIYDRWEGKQYISEVDFTANKSIGIKDYAQPGFYFYYNNSDNSGRIRFIDDNRGEDYTDDIRIGQEGLTFINSKIYINNSINTSIEFDPNIMHHLKIVRLNKIVYVHYDNHLAYTTKFEDKNPEGRVGFIVYACTGYFDNFYLRPITMNNASCFINELNLNSTNSITRIGSIYTLHLDKISNNNAHFSLSKFGKTIDNTTASKGDIVSLNFENGNEGVKFKITQLSKN